MRGTCPQLCDLGHFSSLGEEKSLHVRGAGRGETKNSLHCLGLFQGLNEPEQRIAREGALFNEAGIKVVGERAPQEKPHLAQIWEFTRRRGRSEGGGRGGSCAEARGGGVPRHPRG